MDKNFNKMIIPYKRYTEIRDADWQLIIDMAITKLPVDIFKLLAALGIKVYTYTDNFATLVKYRLENKMKKCDAFTLFLNNQYIIFYDDTQLPARIRFTLAHELGHIILDSGFSEMPSGLLVSTRNSEPSENDAPEETEANMFAARILAPSCVLHELKLFTVEPANKKSSPKQDLTKENFAGSR